MTGKQFLELVDEMTIMSTSPESLVKKINKLFYKMDMASMEEDALTDTVQGLSDNAKSALVQALKDEDMAKVLSILGMKASTKRGVI